MSRRLRGSTTGLATQPSAASGIASPPATRQRRARWQDPKLWLGVVLVLVSVVAGAKVLGSADDSVAVWQVTRDVPAGSPVGSSDLRATRVHFDEPALAASYLEAAAPIADGAIATRDLHTGEMLTVHAVTSTRSTDVQVPLGVSSTHQPPDLRAGDHVQVWAVPTAAGGQQEGSTPELVLGKVPILSLGSGQAGASGMRQVLVAVHDNVDLSRVLRLTAGAQVILVRLAG